MSGLPAAVGFSSATLNEQQKEENYFAVVAYQKSTGDLDLQASLFGRRSEVQFTPDPVGDLYFNGVAAEVDVFEQWFGDLFDELFGSCR